MLSAIRAELSAIRFTREAASWQSAETAITEFHIGALDATERPSPWCCFRLLFSSFHPTIATRLPMSSPVQHVGKMLGRYRLLEQIGAGGMGVVFRAHDERLGRDVAIKLLAPGSIRSVVARHRVRNEAMALSRLNHPNIETIFEFDTQDDADF